MHTICKHIQVSKILISVGITFSTMAGYLICFPFIDNIFWITAISSLLLCSGAGTLNNYQDRHTDKLLQRTLTRPLPSGSVSEKAVLIQALIFITSGLVTFCFTRNPIPTLFTALLGIIFYNGIYTPLKSHTIMAIFPGAICGMIPPLMGWSAAGGNILAIGEIIWVMAILGVWQFPHFWLILLRHADDYEKLRDKQILPNMLTFFNRSQLRQIMLIWILLYSVTLMMIPLFYSGLSKTAFGIVVLDGITLFVLFVILHFINSKRNNRFEYIVLNSSLMISILVIIIDRIL